MSYTDWQPKSQASTKKGPIVTQVTRRSWEQRCSPSGRWRAGCPQGRNGNASPPVLVTNSANPGYWALSLTRPPSEPARPVCLSANPGGPCLRTPAPGPPCRGMFSEGPRRGPREVTLRPTGHVYPPRQPDEAALLPQPRRRGSERRTTPRTPRSDPPAVSRRGGWAGAVAARAHSRAGEAPLPPSRSPLPLSSLGWGPREPRARFRPPKPRHFDFYCFRPRGPPAAQPRSPCAARSADGGGGEQGGSPGSKLQPRRASCGGAEPGGLHPHLCLQRRGSRGGRPGRQWPLPPPPLLTTWTVLRTQAHPPRR